MESLPLGPDGAIQFDFDYRHIRFRVRWDEESERFRLAGDVATLPYSAQAPAARAGMAQVVFEANDALGMCFRMMGNHILIGRDIEVPRPLTATKAIAAVGTLVIPLIPYLELLGCYVRMPLERKGNEPMLRAEWRGKPLPHLNVRTRFNYR